MPRYSDGSLKIALTIVVGCLIISVSSVQAAITPPEGDPSIYNPNGVTLEQGLPSGYTEGEEVEIAVNIAVPDVAAGAILALGLEQELPEGWTYARMGRLISGKLPDVPPNGLTGYQLAFAWVTIPNLFPYHFTYYAAPAGDQSEPLTLRGQVQYRTTGPAYFSDIAELTLDLDADNEPPAITLIGGEIVVVERGDGYLDPGWTATDNVDGDISEQVEVDGLDTLDTDTIGEYTLTYRVSDAAGNHALPKTRTVKVVKPKLTLKELLGCGPLEREKTSGLADLVVVAVATLALLGGAGWTARRRAARTVAVAETFDRAPAASATRPAGRIEGGGR